MPNPTLSPGAKGADVATLQQALIEHAGLPVAAAQEEKDAVYGPITQGAIKSFQAAHGLTSDGVVGPKTWAALLGQEEDPPTGVVPPADLALASPIGKLAIEIAESQLGIQENPLGSNRGPMVDVYLAGEYEDAEYLLQARKAKPGQPAAEDGWQGAPWCGRFAKFCVDRAVVEAGSAVLSPIKGWGDLASAWKWRDAAQIHGAWRDKPQAGRVALIIVEGDKDHPPHGHVVLLAGEVEPDGMVWTREGNSRDKVAARHRNVAEFTGGFVAV